MQKINNYAWVKMGHLYHTLSLWFRDHYRRWAERVYGPQFGDD